MPVNLDSNLISQSDIQPNMEDANVASTKSTVGIDISKGITETSEANLTGTITGSTEIPSLEAPTLPLEEVLSNVIKLDAQSAQLLGVAEGTSMNMAEFNKAILAKLDAKMGSTDTSSTEDSKDTSSTKGLDISKMDGETLDLFCLLLCQESKKKMIDSFKELLNTKKNERNDKQQAYVKEVAEVTKKNIEAAEKAKKAERKAKIKGIITAVLSAVVAAVTTFVAIAITAASFGTLGPVALSLAISGCVFAAGSLALTTVSTSLTIASLCTNDEKNKDILNKVALGFGIAAAVVGIYGAICSGGATIGAKGIEMGGKILGALGSAASGLSQCVSGGLNIWEGVDNIKLAEMKKELDEMKIDLAKLDETIAIINKLIEILSNDIQDFIQNLLGSEQQAARELINISDAQNNLANEMPC